MTSPLPTHILGVDVVALAECHAQSPSSSRGTLHSVQAIQSAHRLRIIEAWLRDGDGDKLDDAVLQGKTLETGCGQGDQSAALAMYIASTPALQQSSAAVLGVDPGPPDYGAPFTLLQAQQQLLGSAVLRPHLDFAPLDGSDAMRVLQNSPSGTYRTLVASMCLWYFAQEQDVGALFKLAHERGVQYILLAEWALKASSLNAVPHVLAVLMQATYPIAGGNVRTVLGIETITSLAEAAGWRVLRQRIMTPHTAMHDGKWEVDAALHGAQERIASMAAEGRDTRGAQATRHSLMQSLPAHGGTKSVECMDMWTAVLVRN